MDELVGRLVAKIGVDRAAAAGAAGAVAQFPNRDTAHAFALTARVHAHAARTVRAVACETIRYERVNAGKNAAGKSVGATPATAN